MTNLIITSNDRDYPRICYPFVEDEVCIFDALEEAVYVWWETVPSHRDWVSELQHGVALFDYHGVEYAIVSRTGEYEFNITFA